MEKLFDIFCSQSPNGEKKQFTFEDQKIDRDLFKNLSKGARQVQSANQEYLAHPSMEKSVRIESSAPAQVANALKSFSKLMIDKCITPEDKSEAERLYELMKKNTKENASKNYSEIAEVVKGLSELSQKLNLQAK